MPNKVRFGLRNAYYAKLTEGSSDSYATPVALPGATAVSLSPVGTLTPFVADDIEYFMSQANNGYDGTLELAYIPEAFQTDIMGIVLDDKNVAFEKNTAILLPFAFLFEFQGDVHAIKHVMYKCWASRHNINGTSTITKEPGKTTLNIMCRPNMTGYVKANTRSTTDATVAANWYSAVQIYVPGT